MELSFYVYLHCKPDGTPFYVGKGHSKRSHEWRRRNLHHKNVVAKYGKEHIGVLVLHCSSEQQAFDDEKRLISTLRQAGYELANYTDGGQGMSGYKPSAKARANMSVGQLGNTNCSGYKHSPETIARMSVAQRRVAHIQSIAHRGNKSRLGLPHSPETRAKIAASHIGKHHTDETRAKISEAHAKRWARRN